MKKIYLSSIVSDEYIFKSIVMHDTLESTGCDFHLFLLCVVDEVYNILSKVGWENVTLLRLNEIENSELLGAKINRTYLEYCWTLKPAMLYYVIDNYSDADYYAHIDADTCFWSSPEQIFDEAPDASEFLTDHNNSPRFLYTYDLTGRFNTGFVGAKNDLVGKGAVAWWRAETIKWCYTANDTTNKLFGDQRHVERWPSIFPNIHVVSSPGANTAFWNVEKYSVSQRDDGVYIDNSKLVFYHFSAVYIYNAKEFNLNWAYQLPENVVQIIYLPYLTLLSRAIEKVQAIQPGFSKGFSPRGIVPEMHYFRL